MHVENLIVDRQRHLTRELSAFNSFFMGGFECSTHRRRDRRRLDLIAATRHDDLALADYMSMIDHNVLSVRDGTRWHLVEATPCRYDWTSFLPMLRASGKADIQVVWDLCHYGWPDWIDIWSPGFIDRFARFAAAVACLVRGETDRVPLYSPINEISYWSWAGGTKAIFNPHARGRGRELKAQLVRASIAAIEAIRGVDPRARFVQIDPIINVVPRSPRSRTGAERCRQAQYEAWDMLAGHLQPDLGGSSNYLDILGVNYYPNNQWFLGGSTIKSGHPLYRPLRDLLLETHHRYHRPIVVAETGAEGDARAPWIQYVCDEVHAALEAGVPVEGICLYPIADYPGWSNGRHCKVGLLGFPNSLGQRSVHAPLAEELLRQQLRFGELHQHRTSKNTRLTDEQNENTYGQPEP
jgi:hypothetical protein